MKNCAWIIDDALHLFAIAAYFGSNPSELPIQVVA
jgi:hypothetical protein